MPQPDQNKSSGQGPQQTDQIVPNFYPSPHQFEDDTINLYELWITIWKRKWLVIAVTVVAALGSLVYALKLQHIYLAEALLLPPTVKDVSSISVPGISRKITELTESNIDPNLPNDVFNRFKQNLNSRTIQRKFIQENGLMELLSPKRTSENRDEDIYNGFAEMIQLEVEEKTSLSIEMHDGALAAKWINDLIRFVDKETISLLLDDVQNSISNKIKEIEYTITSKREMAKQRRMDQIIRYDEAAKIAYSLGIKKRVDATNIIQSIQPATQMNVDISTSSTPLYYLGHEALMTEISILKNRKSDDPFISGLRDLQEHLSLLRSIKLEKEKMKAVKIDRAAFPPKYPIKPNREFIVLLATVVGLFSGILLTFFIEFVQNHRKKHSD